MANPSVFFDSNILLYTDDQRVPAKQSFALDLVARHTLERTGVISIQVLQEYFQNATSKMKLDASIARQKVSLLSELFTFRPVVDDILAAIDLHRLNQVSFWDAMIVQAAIQSGCKTLYSEDMQNGRQINGVEIVNPFL